MTDRAPDWWLNGEEDPSNQVSTRAADRAVGSGSVVVRSGDCVHALAAERGVPWEQLWNDPANEELRRVRKSPELLLPGDRVTAPPVLEQRFSLATGRRHRFHAPRATVPIELKLLSLGRPRGGVDYVLSVAGEEHRGTTDDEGCIRARVPATARTGRLSLRPSEGAEEESFDLAIGALDPIETVRGLQARLRNLGLTTEAPSGAWGAGTCDALRALQKLRGLTETGEPDDETVSALRRAHGC